ncbi:MAG: glycosyltransferase [bacterium]|nr:glycosyltransferase [bacterium]
MTADCSNAHSSTSPVLRVLALNYEYPPIGGGGANAHRHLMNEWARMEGLDVTLIAPSIGSRTEREELSPTARVITYPLKKRDLHYWRRGEIIRYLIQHDHIVRDAAQEKDFDLCHAFFGFPTGLIAWRRCANIPYIVSVRGSDVPGYNKRFGIDYVFLKPLLKRIYSHAAAVVANSEGLRELYESAFPGQRAGVIANGVDVERFQPSAEKRRPPGIAAVGRLIPRKGFDLLPRACAELARMGYDFECRVIGGGPEAEPLQRLAAELNLGERFQIMGPMPSDQLARFLPACSAFVLPSHAEGMSNAALEAMACGLPLLLSDVGGSRELIDGNGAIVPRGDVDALTNTLAAWLADPARMEAMGRVSRERAMAFSWRAAAEQYHALYREIAERRAFE